jgi:Flp pilus assembly protein TadD
MTQKNEVMQQEIESQTKSPIRICDEICVLGQGQQYGTQITHSFRQPAQTVTAGFIRVDQAKQLRQQKKLDRAQRICESLVREHPDYVAALHTLGLVPADKENCEQALNYPVRAAMLNPRAWATLTALRGIYVPE